MTRLVSLSIMVVAAALSSGCSYRASIPQPSGSASIVGTVTTLSPRLCVGQHAATGDCFTGADASTLSGLHVGDCVTVEFTLSSGPGPQHLKTISVVPASSHRDDCPSG